MKNNEIIKNYLRQRSDTSFEKIVETYTPLVFSACLRKTTDEDASKDVTQQVFLAFHKKAHSLINHPNIAGWFYQAALFASAKYLRKKVREQKRIEKLQEINDLNEEARNVWFNKTKADLDDAIQQIPEKLRLAIVQHYLVGNSVIEASEELNISKAAMHKRLARGREVLKDILSKRHVGITSTIMLSILSSSELRAVPQSIVSKIIASHSSSLSIPLNLTGKILIMSTSKKIILAAVTLLLSAVFTMGLIAQKENKKKTKVEDKQALAKNDVKPAKNIKLSTASNKNRINVSREAQFKENNLTGKDLLTHITSIFKEDKSKWYRILREGGIKMDEVFFNELLDRSFGPNSVTHKNSKRFLFTLFKEWGKYSEKDSLDWLLERKVHDSPLARYIFNGINEENPDQAKALLNKLPDSKEKEIIASFMTPIPFDQLINNFDQMKAQMGTLSTAAMQGLSNKMVKSNPEQAIDWASKNLDQKSFSSFIKGSARILAEEAPSLALTALENMDEGYLKTAAINDMIEGSIENAPDISKKLLEKLSNHELLDSLNQSLGYLIFIKNEQGKAMNWAESLDPKYRELVSSALATQLSKRDFNKALEYAESNLKGDSLDFTLSEIAAESSNYNLEQSSNLVQSILRNKELTLYNQKRESGKTYSLSKEEKLNMNLYSSVNNISKNMIMRKPDEAVLWLEEIPFKTQSDHQEVLLHSLEYWHNRYPEDARNWALSSSLNQNTLDEFFKRADARP